MKKAIMCIFLSLLLILTPSVSLAGYITNEPVNPDSYPLVVVRGMDFTGLYLDEGTPNERPALGDLSLPTILKALFKIGSKYILNNPDGAVDEMKYFLDGVLGNYACDTDGQPVFNVAPHTYPGAIGNFPDYSYGNTNEWGIVKRGVEMYGDDNVYYFVYDWRLNPLDVADDINDMVDLALDESGKDKVNLVNASMGGVMTTAYLTKYGHEKLNKCIFLSSTFGGSDLLTELFQGKAYVDTEALYNTLYFYSNNFFLRFIVDLSNKSGLLNKLADFANNFIETYKTKAYEEFLTDCFGHMLSIWALIKPESYEACLDFMFGDRDQEEYEGFIAKTAALQEMMANSETMLKNAQADGLEIAVVTSYNTPALPLTETAFKAHTDSMLESSNMSKGATFANYNETLAEDILNGDSAYISTDKVIDASTALFPDHSWFFKDSIHVGCGYGTDQSDFLFWLLEFDGPANIESNEAYPQFMLSNEALTLKPLS